MRGQLAAAQTRFEAVAEIIAAERTRLEGQEERKRQRELERELKQAKAQAEAQAERERNQGAEWER